MNDVITYYLEMHSIDELNEKQESNGLSVIEAEIKNYRFNRYLYQLVGEPWQQVGRAAPARRSRVGWDSIPRVLCA